MLGDLTRGLGLTLVLCLTSACIDDNGSSARDGGSVEDGGEVDGGATGTDSGVSVDGGATGIDEGVRVDGGEQDRCEPGTSVPAGDGCNACRCPESGLLTELIECTEAECPRLCESSAECEDDEFCQFGGGCLLIQTAGICRPRPLCMEPGGAGACSCDGVYAESECAIQSQGGDVFVYGGCSPEDSTVYRCGSQTCDVNTEYCEIYEPGMPPPEGQPHSDNAACRSLPDGCEQGDCGCFEMLNEGPDSPSCFDGTGKTFLYFLGL